METDQKICLSRLEPQLAAALLAGLHRADPAGTSTPADVERIAREGMSFAATADNAQAVYTIHVKNGVAWIDACKGNGPVPWSDVLFAVIEAQSKGCAAVGFQTARPGLVRQAKRHGYEVTGWILKKALQ